MFKDIVDTIRDLNFDDTFKDHLRRDKNVSLSKRSLKGTLQFPALVSKSIDIETSQMTTKAIERQCCTFVQIAFSMSPIMNIDKEKDAEAYLKKFHQNQQMRMNVQDVSVTAANIFLESAGMHNPDRQVYVVTAVLSGSTPEMIKEHLDHLRGQLEDFNVQPLNDKFIPVKEMMYISKDPAINARLRAVVEDVRDAELDLKHAEHQRQLAKDRVDAATKSATLQHQRTSEKNRLELSKAKQELDSLKFRSDREISLPSNIMKDNDARKANELVATTLQIRTHLVNEKQEDVGSMDFIIGVKATMHPVASEDMVSNLVKALRSGGSIFNFIKWTTGETSFFKDFVFAMNEIKQDVIDQTKGSSAWWVALKRRKALAKIKNAVPGTTSLIPNASIIISQDEVDYINSEYGFNLLDSSTAYRIMQKYFLLSFVVVDNATQIVHFLFDGQEEYQSNTFSALERENSSKSDMREVLKIINRANTI